MPDMFIDEDGIFNIRYGTQLLTVNHMVHSLAEHRRLNSKGKMPIMVVTEAATNVDGEMIKVGKTDWFANVTVALAIVTRSKLANILRNVFMSLQSNPYPTKLFSDEAKARDWLLSTK